MNGKPRRSKIRRGTIAMEAVLAAGLLVTASIAVARYAMEVRRLDRNADASLAAEIAGDNVASRLRVTPPDQWTEKAESIEREVRETSGVKTLITVSEFESADSQGMHAEILCGSGLGRERRTHAWAFVDASESAEESP